MERSPLSPRDDGTFDFNGTFLQTLHFERLEEQVSSSPEPIDRLGAYLELKHLSVGGISVQVRQRAQEKIDAFLSKAETA